MSFCGLTPHLIPPLSRERGDRGVSPGNVCRNLFTNYYHKTDVLYN